MENTTGSGRHLCYKAFMLFQTVVVGPFQCNCRLIACPDTGDAILIDPGDDAEAILQAVQKASAPGGPTINIKYLLHTHGHLDHIGATREVAEAPVGKDSKIAL